MKILILKPSSLGDVVQALPVLRLLKRNFPSSEIHWWISQDLQPLLEYDPDLMGIIPFERRGWARPANWKRLMQSVARARAMRFDWVIDLQALARSALFGWLASGRFFIGLDDSREGAPALYDRAVPRPSFHTHAVDWYLEVLKSLGVPVHWDFDWLPVRPEIEASVERRWPRADDRWILLNPGARWPNKRWPAESFAELAVILSRRMPGARFAVLGGSSDVPLAKTISKAVEGRCVDLTGQTSLP
ncbi:MAG: glycosyltransferase family 9 protein, partial [Verrucomicrobiota bacterium]